MGKKKKSQILLQPGNIQEFRARQVCSPASFTKSECCPSTGGVLTLEVSGAATLPWTRSLARASLGKGRLKGIPPNSLLLEPAPQKHKFLTKWWTLLSFQAVIFKTIFLNTSCPSFSIKQQPRNTRDVPSSHLLPQHSSHHQVLLRSSLGRTAAGICEERPKSTWRGALYHSQAPPLPTSLSFAP